MGIRNVPVHPRSPWLQAGGPLLFILLLVVVGIAIGLVILQRSRTMPEQQVVPTAGQAINVVPSARDQWWLEQPVQPQVTAPVRDQWWLEQPVQPAVTAPVRDRWWAEQPVQPAVTAPVRDRWWAEQPAATAPARDQWWLER